MKGYYHFSVFRKMQAGTSFKYVLEVTKYIFDEVNINELIRLKDEPEPPEHLKYVGCIGLLREAGLKQLKVFSISCNYPTAMRIRHGLRSSIPESIAIDPFMMWRWGDPVKITQNAVEIELSNEDFLSILQKCLDELPKNTFSKKNKQKVIDAFMASF